MSTNIVGNAAVHRNVHFTCSQHMEAFLFTFCYIFWFYQVILEGVYALHPDIRKSLDLWIAVVSSERHHFVFFI